MWDTELRGFVVRVRASGRRWFAVERMRDRRTRRVSLGELGAETVEQARDRAKKVLARVAHGEDPAAKRTEERTAPTSNRPAGVGFTLESGDGPQSNGLNRCGAHLPAN